MTEVFRIASGDNSYDLPSRGTIVSRIHSLYDGERARIIQLLEQAATVAPTGDHWTSVSNGNYLVVTAHFIDNVWNLRSFALEVKKKNRGATYSGELCRGIHRRLKQMGDKGQTDHFRH